MNFKKFLLITILGISSILRLISLGNIPNSLTPDEASQGYTAYSILTTGKDEWGNSNLLSLRSYGDYKPPFQTLLMIPSIRLFGLNSFSIRLPSAIFGIITVFSIYLLASLLFNQNVGLLSALFASVSPWLLPLSRIALEANLIIPVFCFGLYFFFRYLQAKRFIFILASAFMFGLTPLIYHSGKIITPLLLMILFIYFRKLIKLLPKIVFSSIIILFFGLAIFTGSSLSQNRTADIAIFHPTDNWQSVSDHRFELVSSGLNDNLARLVSNKAQYTLSTFLSNYLSYFSFHFLLTQGVAETTYGMMPGRGVIGLIPFLGLLVFGYLLTKKPSLIKRHQQIMFWLLLIAPLPSALAKGQFSGNRTSLLALPLIILAAFGINYLFKLKNKYFNLFLTVIFINLSLIFIFDYFFRANSFLASGMLYGHRELNEYLSSHPDSQVIYSRKLSEPQAYYLFYQKPSPVLVQNYTLSWLEYEARHLSFLDQLGEYRLPGVVFKEISYNEDSLLSNTIIAGRPEEFPAGIKPSLQINYPNTTKAAIVVVNTNEIE